MEIPTAEEFHDIALAAKSGVGAAITESILGAISHAAEKGRMSEKINVRCGEADLQVVLELFIAKGFAVEVSKRHHDAICSFKISWEGV